MNRSVDTDEIRVGQHSVRLTRPKKVLFPEDGIDKRALAKYYEYIADAYAQTAAPPARHEQTLPHKHAH